MPIRKLLVRSAKILMVINNIELEEQRKLELMLKAEQNKVKEIAAKEAKN